MDDDVLVDGLVAEQVGVPVVAELMEAVRGGHLCVRTTAEGVGVRQLEGHEEWFEEPVGVWNDLVYLQRCWVLESRVVRELKRLMVDVKRVDFGEGGELNERQAEAVRKGLGCSVFCLSGGPGTGKSHTVVELVKRFGGKVVVAAPTGKAVSGLKGRLDVECGTLHRLLGIRGMMDILYGKTVLDADMVVVDECSMIDVGMWGALLRAVCTGTRLVLVGDHDQLPPVEAGTVYGEICGWMRERHPEGYVFLDRCMRSDQAEILEQAAAVKRGEVVKGIEWGKRLDVGMWKKCFQGPMRGEVDVQALLEEMKGFRILSCMRQGPFGVEAINRELLERFRSDYQEGDVWPIPVMVTRTSYRLEVCNGEMGVLLKRSGSVELGKDDLVYFEDRSVPAVLLPGLEWGYAISVHKSQGSEYDRVALVVPPGSEFFGREILYTGITRARVSLEIYGNEETLELCVAGSAQKLSGIRRKLEC